jgi:tetratricopeptide (TPR) repeat protein
MTEQKGGLLISSNIEILQEKLADIRESDRRPCEEEIVVLLDLADIMNRKNPHEACFFAEQALSIIRELEIEIHYARCYKIIGISNAHKGDYEKALEYSLKALAIYEDSNNSTALSSRKGWS